MYEICSKLTIKTPELRQCRRSDAVNFEQISYAGHSILTLNGFLLLTLNKFDTLVIPLLTLNK